MAALEGERQITVDILRAACATAEYFRQCAVSLLEGFGMSPVDRLIQKICEVVQTKECHTKADVQKWARVRKPGGGFYGADVFNEAWATVWRAETLATNRDTGALFVRSG